MRIIFIFQLSFAFGPSVLAATCTSPDSGRTRYNAAAGIMEFCNGSTWIGMANTSVTPCSPSQSGRVRYDGSAADYQFCSGAQWYSIKSATATACTVGDVGKMRWNSSTSAIQFCDGGNWWNAGSALAATGFFVLTPTLPGNGNNNDTGLVGLNANCLDLLRNGTWKGKSSAGQLTSDRVKAFVCDGSICNNLKASKQYAFAVLGDPNFGGTTFTTDATGADTAADTSAWNDSGRFGGNYHYWTARAAGSGVWGGATTSHCSNWTSMAGTFSGTYGDSSVATSGRWSAGTLTCDNYLNYICFVDPPEERADPFAFVDQSGLGTSVTVTSNIVAITGLSAGVSVFVGGAGSPKYRICANATCSASPAFTSSAGTITNGKFLQLQATTAANTGVLEAITVTVGGTQAIWNVATSGIATGYFVLTPPSNLGNAHGYGPRFTDQDCVNQLRSLNWRGKSEAGTLKVERVHSWLCRADDGACQNLMPNVKYAFAAAGDATAGGATFTTDANGLGPGDSTAWSGATYFATTATIATGRNAGTASLWSASPIAGQDCAGWVDSTAGNVWSGGKTNLTGSARWSGTTGTSCATAGNFICTVDPLPTFRLVFQDVLTAGLNSVVTSNIVSMSEMNTAATVSTNSIGMIQIRVCNDANCSSVAQDWTYQYPPIQPSQYLQLRLTASSYSGTTLTAKVYLGTTPEIGLWNVTTVGSPTNGYLVLSNTTRNGNFGGLSGANAICLSELSSGSWKGKSTAGTLNASRVRFWGCDANRCQNGLPNSTYLYAVVGSSSYGGAGFNFDQTSYGPDNMIDWAGAPTFASDTTFWTGREWYAASIAPTYLRSGLEAVASHMPANNATCAGFTSSVSGNNGSYGDTSQGGTSRWMVYYDTCNTTRRFACMVDPAVFPNAFSFTNQTGVSRSTLITSNVVQITGLSVPAIVTLTPGLGDPQYRVCSDSACTGEVQTWTTNAVGITNGQYLQLRMTSSSASQRAHAVNLAVGGTSTTWTATTADGCAHNTTSFASTGAAQTFTVPANCGNVTFKAWGAGGAGSSGTNTWAGGAGAYVTSTIPALPGDVLKLYVGGAGTAGTSTKSGGYYGGGKGNNNGGAGGGGTALFFDDNTAELSASWTPHYSNIISYFRGNGTGSLANGTAIAATVGPNGSAANADGSGMAYGAGNLNNAFSLDGQDDYISIPGFTGLDNLQQMTFSGWFKTSALNDFAILADASVSTTDRVFILQAWYGTGAGKLTLTIGQNYAATMQTVNSVINLGEWQHFAVVFDGRLGTPVEKVAFYVNGALVPSQITVYSGTMNLPSVTPVTSGTLSFGGTARDYPRYSGQMDEIAIWNVALTQEEIQRITMRQGTVAHAAGGGGGGVNTSSQAGGAGGVATGANGGADTRSGKGATSAAGGAKGTGTGGTAGARTVGGDGTSGNTGGGGGGFYGGGGGALNSGNAGGGGGGSSYVTPALSGSSALTPGTATTPGGNGDANYTSGVGVGGAAATNGGPGRIYISY